MKIGINELINFKAAGYDLKATEMIRGIDFLHNKSSMETRLRLESGRDSADIQKANKINCNDYRWIKLLLQLLKFYKTAEWI